MLGIVEVAMRINESQREDCTGEEYYNMRLIGHFGPANLGKRWADIAAKCGIQHLGSLNRSYTGMKSNRVLAKTFDETRVIDF